MRKPLFISWAKLRRADSIAEKLGMSSHAIRYFYRGAPRLLTLWKYFLQALHTFFLLLWRRPSLVFVTSPPVFAVFPVYIYGLIFRSKYVIDFHSGCFVEEVWRRWDRWQRFFARRAVLNIVHNQDNARAVQDWGVPHAVLPSLPPVLPQSRASVESARPLVVYICSFKADEPVDAFLEGARGLPGVDFAVTGRPPEGVRARLPSNVKLTGFLPDDEYNELLSGADLIVALTTRPGTLLYGAQEAIALRKPLVLSRTPTLEAYFTGGVVFAENSPEGLKEGVEQALARKVELSAQMAVFEKRFRAEGEVRLADIWQKVKPAAK